MTDLSPHARAVSLSLRHLKLFESVARLSSVRRASEECHLSQPAVTQAIAKLEEQIGLTLLERRASGSYLNDCGKIFQRRIQRLFAQIEEALEELGAPIGPTPIPIIASRITRSQIRSLIAIVENGSFGQAARALQVSQASLHRAARDLEQNLRKTLYHRTAFGIMATPPAAEFARKLKLAAREIESGIEELEAATGNFGSQMVIGAMPLAGSVMLASVLNEFITSSPSANVRIASSNADEILRNLRAGDVDFVIGLVGDPPAPDLVSEAVVETPYVVVARQGHPLLQKSAATLEDLAAYDWVIGTPGSNRRQRFDKLFADRARPMARVETSSMATIRLLLSNSDRLTLLTSYELKYAADMLKPVPFGALHPAPSVGLIMRENWLPTPLQAKFLELFRQRVHGALEPAPTLKRVG
ncbi:MAG TPA: LysR family transcriptional regulator [Caulobacteraceae bacterium]|nr:LysR family transcriptional regulator [Caulobacteraceae bacterium]